MKIILSVFALFNFISNQAFADVEIKTFKAVDGSYEIKVSHLTSYRCRKDNFFMDYKVFDDQANACALIYAKVKCLKFTEEDSAEKFDRACEVGKWEELQAEKVIATSRSSTAFCHNKVAAMIEKFKAQNFICGTRAGEAAKSVGN